MTARVPTAPSSPVTAGDPIAAEVKEVLGRLEDRVRIAVRSRREIDPNPDDSFRGLYVSDDQADRLLAGGWPAIDQFGSSLVEEYLVDSAVDEPGQQGTSRLAMLAKQFDLSPQEVDIVVAAMAPDVDSRFERLYGYLNDDVTKRRATIGLGLELCGLRPENGHHRALLSANSSLVEGGLVVVEDTDHPFLTRSLRVPDRVVAHILGYDSPSPELVAIIRPHEQIPAATWCEAERATLCRALKGGLRLAYLKERSGSTSRSVAVAALVDAGYGTVEVDLRRLSSNSDIPQLARLAGREAQFGNAGVVAGPLDALGEVNSQLRREWVRVMTGLSVPVVLYGRSGFDPSWCAHVPLTMEVPAPGQSERIEMWSVSLPELVSDAELADAVATYRLGPDEVSRAAAAARLYASSRNEKMSPKAIQFGARSENASALEQLAKRVTPDVGFEDLVLPAGTKILLEEIVERVRYRDVVLGQWGLRPGGGRGSGVTALFAGDSGTGKTMSAEVLAGALGMDLYTVNLATVVDKYIGETEKNLERIFTEVDGVNGVLLFDEADALFGKRSEVRDAHDRYANIEVAYLLQRIESFDGLALLATNLRANVDEAFTRRLDAVVEFMFPDQEQRLALWNKSLRGLVPLGDDVELEILASSFELAGGNIASISLTAAYCAAASGTPLSMADMIRAVHREYRKLGRLSVRSEFGEWYSVIEQEQVRHDARPKRR